MTSIALQCTGTERYWQEGFPAEEKAAGEADIGLSPIASRSNS
jgi:hypothetical protein